ncbi:MAG: Asp-tRNA(Asn)/Glu-tRNA(Gln) amidotransferase subunit GatC [Bacillota bacterium]
MKLSKEEIEHLAWLARLELNEEQAGRLAGQISRILDYVEQMNQLDTSDVPPTFHTLPELSNVFRDDIPDRSLSREKALQSAPARHQGYILVPKVRGGEPQ